MPSAQTQGRLSVDAIHAELDVPLRVTTQAGDVNPNELSRKVIRIDSIPSFAQKNHLVELAA